MSYYLINFIEIFRKTQIFSEINIKHFQNGHCQHGPTYSDGTEN